MDSPPPPSADPTCSGFYEECQPFPRLFSWPGKHDHTFLNMECRSFQPRQCPRLSARRRIYRDMLASLSSLSFRFVLTFSSCFSVGDYIPPKGFLTLLENPLENELYTYCQNPMLYNVVNTFKGILPFGGFSVGICCW